MLYTGKAIPVTGLDWLCRFQEFEDPRFHDSRLRKVVRFSPTHRPPLLPKEIFLVLISVRGWVDPGAIVRPEILFP